MMTINWISFSQMLPFMLFGLLVHIFGKFSLARKKEGYRFGTFVFMNWTAWVMSLFYCLIGCYFISRGIDVLPGVAWDISAILIGISGGSLGKTTVKLFNKK